MKKKLFRVLCIVFVLATATLLAGCLPTAYTKEQKEAIEAAAKPMIEKYLNDNFKGAKARNYCMHEGDIDADKFDMTQIGSTYWGRCPTYVVEAGFVYQNKEYRICVDTNTGEIYTSYYFDDLMAAYDKVMKENFQSLGITGDFATYEITLATEISNDGIEMAEYADYAPTTTYVDDVISDSITPDNVEQYIRQALMDDFSNIHTKSWMGNNDKYHVIPYSDTQKLAENLPGLGAFDIFAVEDFTMDYLREHGEMPGYWEMTISEAYSVASVYFCRQYECFEEDGIIINSPVADCQDSDVPDKTFNPKITYSAKEKECSFQTCEYEFTYLFFDNPNTHMGFKKIKLPPGYKPNKVKFKDCGDGIYTLDDSYFEYAFKFLGRFQISGY